MKHVVVYSDPHLYCAHPHLVRAADGSWLVVFNIAPRKEVVLHPPEEPLFRNALIRSHDNGISWSPPEIVPSYTYSGTECAGLTTLNDGRVMLNQWQFEWYPLSLARRLRDQDTLTYPSAFMANWESSPEHVNSSHDIQDDISWVRGGGRTMIHFSDDHGCSFTDTVEVSTAPFSGGYGMRGAVQLSDGRIILPLCDVPKYRQVFIVESSDLGSSWSNPTLIGSSEAHEFEEPAIVVCKSGRLLMVLRENRTRVLHQTVSDDLGRTWSAPKPIEVTGYPAHLHALDDGRILMTYGWRRPDFGVRAVISRDEGASWDIAHTISVRGGLPSKNVGYPCTLPTADGFFTIYYGEVDGVTSLLGTFWSEP